jgi:alpha-1,6-mannosyltransferase
MLGVALCVALTICSRHFGDRGGPYFMASLTVAGIVYLLAIREFFVTPIFPRRVVVIGLVLAAAWNIAFLRLPSGADDDIHRYVWDGRLQRLGYNPYIVVPSDPAAEGLHTPETRNLNNPDLPSPYPAGAELFFRAVTAIQESTFAFKVAFVVCEFAIVFVLLDVLRRTGQGQRAHLVLAFAWNPLLAIEVAGSGHIDIVGALLLVVSAAALVRRWRATAAVTLGLAIAVKFLPVVLLPLYWKRVRIRDAALAVAVAVLLYLPFLNHGRIPIGSLGTYVQTFRFNGPVFAILDRVAPPQLLVALAVLVGLGTATWQRMRRAAPESSPDVFAWPMFAWPMAASLLCAPAIFPWYLLWLLPFLTSASTLLIIIWTVSIIPVYVQWHLRTLGHPWGSLPGWVMLVEYGCVAGAAAVILVRQITRPEEPQRLTD